MVLDEAMRCKREWNAEKKSITYLWRKVKEKIALEDH